MVNCGRAWSSGRAGARRPACLLTELLPGEPDPQALRALLSFQLSRWPTRAGPDGALLTLDAQNRAQWDRELIADGARALEIARRGERGALLLQAELAGCHATAATFAATDWAAILALYDELLAVQDTPVVALNRAVAVAMAAGPAAALLLLDRLAEDPALRGSHRVWAVRADVHLRAGDTWAALADYERALDLVTNEAERRYLATARRLAEEDPVPAALQGGLVLAQVQRDTRPLETAVDTVLELARLRRRDGPTAIPPRPRSRGDRNLGERT
jgi:predicted RNA polymerase sigma factor